MILTAMVTVMTIVLVTAAPSASPAGSPTPSVCQRPDAAARVVRAVEPEVPAMAQQQGILGTVQILVSLDAASRIVGLKVVKSPSVLLNGAAMRAARASTYQTAIHDCNPVPSDFLLSVNFKSS